MCTMNSETFLKVHLAEQAVLLGTIVHPLSNFIDAASGFHFKIGNLYIQLTLTIVTTLLGFETLATRISFAVENNRFGYAEKTEKIQ